VSPCYIHKPAREDLIEIWLDVATRNSAAVADRVYDSIEQSCRLLQDHPLLGRAGGRAVNRSEIPNRLTVNTNDLYPWSLTPRCEQW
jgi:plasmid stabilization system protein ParE